MSSRQQAGEGNSQESPIEFNREEMEKLKNLLGSLEKSSSTGTCTLAFPGISSSLLISKVLDISTISSRTHSSQKFISYMPYPSNKKIKIAYGSVTTVAG